MYSDTAAIRPSIDAFARVKKLLFELALDSFLISLSLDSGFGLDESCVCPTRSKFGSIPDEPTIGRAQDLSPR